MVAETKPQVLVVDDDPVSLLVASHILADRYEVTSAASAAEAHQLLREHRWDLVVSDYLMPEQNGLELIAALHDEVMSSALAMPPCILLTGFGAHAELDDARTTLVQEFLTKPVQSLELLAAAERLVGGYDRSTSAHTAK